MAQLLHELSSLGIALFFAAQFVGIALIPVGIPGSFIQVLAAALLNVLTHGERMGWRWVAVFLALALLAELINSFLGEWGIRKFGGTKHASWGALIGGILGGLFGGVFIPILLVGSMLGSIVGTFAGALGGEMYRQRKLSTNMRVGFGAMLGLAVGVAAKLFIALLIFILSIIAVVSP